MAKDTRTTRSRRAPLSRERVVAAAVQLADADGIDTVSMRSLARRLGVEAMSLYNHVGNKDDLLAAMIDVVVSEIALPSASDDWKAEIRKRALSARDAFGRHPWAPPLLVSNLFPGPATLRYVDATLGCLHAAGFSYPMADHAWNAIDSHIYGFTLLEQNFPIEPDGYAEAARQYLPVLPAERYPHLHALTTLVADGVHDGANEFRLGLDILLDGLERTLPQR